MFSLLFQCFLCPGIRDFGSIGSLPCKVLSPLIQFGSCIGLTCAALHFQELIQIHGFDGLVGALFLSGSSFLIPFHGFIILNRLILLSFSGLSPTGGRC